MHPFLEAFLEGFTASPSIRAPGSPTQVFAEEDEIVEPGLPIQSVDELQAEAAAEVLSARAAALEAEAEIARLKENVELAVSRLFADLTDNAVVLKTLPGVNREKLAEALRKDYLGIEIVVPKSPSLAELRERFGEWGRQRRGAAINKPKGIVIGGDDPPGRTNQSTKQGSEFAEPKPKPELKETRSHGSKT